MIETVILINRAMDLYERLIFKEEEQMEAKVDQFLKQKRFTFAGKRVLVGVSGGRKICRTVLPSKRDSF